MQNNHRKNTKAKLYGIALAVCAVVIGVSGYFFVSDASEEQQALQVSATEQSTMPPVTQHQPQQEQERDKPSVQTQIEVEQTVMPVTGQVLYGYASEKLAYNTTTRDWRTHNGVDIAAALGENVKAAKGGTVMSVYEDEQYGYTVVLQHTGGYTTAYGGLAEQVPVHAGQVLAAGEIIGQVGNTALVEKALEPHLHFEVCQNAVPVDPAGFLY